MTAPRGRQRRRDLRRRCATSPLHLDAGARRAAGWSCRRRWGRSARPVRPLAKSRSVGCKRPGIAMPARRQRRHAVTLRRMVTTSQMNNGVPNEAVTHPDRDGPVQRRRANEQVGERPAGWRRSAAAGTIARPGMTAAEAPRPNTGATRPTKPIAPQTDTQAPTAIADKTMTSSADRRGR